MLAEDNVSGLLTPEAVPICRHILIDILVTDLRLLVAHALTLQRLVQTDIRHHSCDNGIVLELSVLFHIFSAYIHDQVAVDFPARLIDRDAAVCIPIVGKTDIQAVFLHKFLKRMDMGASAVCIDVRTIRMVVDDICFCTECVKHTLCNRAGAAIGAVDSDSVILEGAGRKRDQVADIAVSARHIILRAADPITRRKRDLSAFAVDVSLNLFLDGSIDLLPGSGDDLDPIVIVWIVTRRNHDPAVKVIQADAEGNGRRRCHMEQVSIRPRSDKARAQRIFKHIAGSSGILSNDNLCLAILMLLSIVPAQKTPDLKCMLDIQCHIRLPAKSICSKVLSHFKLPPLYASAAFASFSACSAAISGLTSWSRSPSII